MKVSDFLLSFIFIVVAGFIAAPLVFAQTNSPTIDLTPDETDFFIEATKGNLPGQETGNQFGENTVVGSTEEDVQSQGGTLIFLQSAEFMEIVSTDTVNDIFGGANANSVLVKGLDENFEEIQEVVNLAAAFNTTENRYMRIQVVEVNGVGTYGVTNIGIISITSANSSTLQVEIPIAQGRSSSSHYTVPAGKNVIVTSFSATMNTGKSVNIFFNQRKNAELVSGQMGPVIVERIFRGLSTPVRGRSFGNLKFDERTDIWFSAATPGGGAGAQVEVNYDFVQYVIGT